MAHLQVQMHLLTILPKDECALEYRFPSIQRIADVAWIPNKLIFEIQCSAITAEEVAKRNADYRKLGWQVIWIFHDHRYNHSKLSAAESILCGLPHYFTNIDQEGKGVIYDQLSINRQGIRQHSVRSSAVNIASLNPISTDHLPLVLQNKVNAWPYCFQGDLVDMWNHSLGVEELSSLDRIAASTNSEPQSLWKLVIYRMIIKPYRLLFQLILEKQCH